MVAEEFFSCCVICVTYVDVSCVVSVTEYVIVFDGGIVAPGGGSGSRRGAVYFTCGFVTYYSDALYFVLVIIHFDDENSGLWWDFYVGDFSRRPIDTFQRALVDLFIGLLVG